MRTGKFYAVEVVPLYVTFIKALRNTKHAKNGMIGNKAEALFSNYVYLRDKVFKRTATETQYNNLHEIEKLLEKFGTVKNLKRIDLLTV